MSRFFIYIVAIILMLVCSTSVAQAKSSGKLVTDEAGPRLSHDIPSQVKEPAVKTFKLFKEIARAKAEVHTARAPQGEARTPGDVHPKNLGGQSSEARALQAGGTQIANAK